MKKVRLLMYSFLLVSLFLSGCINNKSSNKDNENCKFIRPVKAMKLSEHSNTEKIIFPGLTKAKREVKLSFRVDGQLVDFDVFSGQKIKKNQQVACLDKRDFDTNVKALKAKLCASKAQLYEAKLQYNRYTKLIKDNAISRAEYDRIVSFFKTMEAQVKADTKKLEYAKNALEDTKLIAPFSGFIHKKFTENYESVHRGQPVISIIDLSNIEVEFEVPEDFIKKIPNFKKISVLFEAVSPKKFSAVFKDVKKKSNLINNTYTATLIIEEGENNDIWPGMTARVFIEAENNFNYKQFSIPSQALFSQNGKDSSVWIFNPEKGMVNQRSVIIKKIFCDSVIVSGDLKCEEWIVVAGVHHLEEGQKVKLLEEYSENNCNMF